MIDFDREQVGKTQPDQSLSEPRRYSTGDLFGDTDEILIEHGDMLYRLRRTSLGKLILTK